MFPPRFVPFLCCAVQAAAAVDVAPPDGIVDIMEAVVAPKVRLSVETHCYHAVARGQAWCPHCLTGCPTWSFSPCDRPRTCTSS